MTERPAIAEITVRDHPGLEGAARSLAAVHELDGYPSWWPADPTRWLSPAGMRAAWVAWLGGVVVGHLCVVGDIDEPAIAAKAGVSTEQLLSVSRLFTHPTGRGQQLGARLLAAAQAYAAAQNAQLMLDVVDDDGTAIHLYDRLQWKRVDRRPSDWTTPDGRRYDTVYFLAPDRPTQALLLQHGRPPQDG